MLRLQRDEVYALGSATTANHATLELLNFDIATPDKEKARIKRGLGQTSRAETPDNLSGPGRLAEFHVPPFGLLLHRLDRGSSHYCCVIPA